MKIKSIKKAQPSSLLRQFPMGEGIFLSINLIIVFAFYTQGFSQSTVISGNIRNCNTWSSGTIMLDNINIQSGHILDANATLTQVNSLSLPANAIVDFSSSNSIQFGGTTSLAPCLISRQSPNVRISTTGYIYISQMSEQRSTYRQQEVARFTITEDFPTTGAPVVVTYYERWVSAGPQRIDVCSRATGRSDYLTWVYYAVNGVIQANLIGSSPSGGITSPPDYTTIFPRTATLHNIKKGDVITVRISFYLINSLLNCLTIGDTYSIESSTIEGYARLFPGSTF